MPSQICGYVVVSSTAMVIVEVSSSKMDELESDKIRITHLFSNRI